ncbi:extradiol ring-cleavage dioxygenase [Cupriavidus necator]|uniref:extradiol ring-cleavage dioxygenase n=1 Tax=Cupriavidus necator TaxID=106590 RepID=UPI0005B45146|nr:extradiol ring-cleavage dioxygenase [Cupriavidus necator]
MAEILGLGLSHYPPLSTPDAQMANILRRTLRDPGIDAARKDPRNWPAPMQAEWGDDEGAASAAAHRAALVAQFRRVRETLDRFQPDVVLMWGDDQYENFREDVIPAFTVCAYDDMDLYPWRHAQGSSMMDGGKPNAWGEGPDMHYRVRGRRDIGKFLASGLVGADFDVAYAYRPLHHESLAHAFGNAILYLDYDRRGWDYPTIAFPINCYGRKVISARGFITNVDDKLDFDPPSPSPARCMALGAATARILRASPWRVAIIASSSWSHAFLCDRTSRLRPDTPSDRALYRALVGHDYDYWQRQSTIDFEDAGQQELLNWCPMLGAMRELGARLDWSDFVETHVFNSNKVFAAYAPA